VGWSIDAEYGITLTIGNKRAEYLINFRDGDCVASDPGLSEVPDYVSTYFGSQPIYRDGIVTFLNINPLREKAFIGILDKSAYRRTSTE
ncbi:hypothetical protein L9G15_22690, partial [Shewanella sp. A3A]|nr:hypothetical protein [Shewanella ferrihydritica]